jgi:biotin transport system substrate-specific component
MENVLSRTFAQRLRLKENLTLDVIGIVLGSVCVGLSSQFAFYTPWSPVPISGQTFAVLLTGAVLGAKRGGLSMALYLAGGVMGLPVFAGGTGGAAVLFGPSVGYLAGFIPAAMAVGALAEKGFDKRWYTLLAAFAVGQAIIYACGISRLTAFVDVRQVIKVGVLPFLPGDAIKAGLAMVLLPSAWKLVKQET